MRRKRRSQNKVTVIRYPLWTKIISDQALARLALAGIMAFSGASVRYLERLSTSVVELNKKMEVVVTSISNHEQRLQRIEDRRR